MVESKYFVLKKCQPNMTFSPYKVRYSTECKQG